jgi:hypothetical protein
MVDRDTASRLGITASAVDEALYSAFGQRIVSTIFTETNQYRVILEAMPDPAPRRAALGNLQLQAPAAGGTTPLSAIARIRPSGRRRCRSRTWRSTRPPPGLRHRARRVAGQGGGQRSRGHRAAHRLPPASR